MECGAERRDRSAIKVVEPSLSDAPRLGFGGISGALPVLSTSILLENGIRVVQAAEEARLSMNATAKPFLRELRAIEITFMRQGF